MTTRLPIGDYFLMHHHTTSGEPIRARRTRVRALASICCAGLLITAAPAAAVQMKDRAVTLEMKLTGTHKIKWQFADSACPDPKRIWDQGSGEQTLSVSMPRPDRFRADLISSSSPVFGRLVPLLLVPMTAPQQVAGVLLRTQDWNENDPALCDREGGCLDGFPAPLPSSIPVCPTRHVSVPLKLDAQLIKPGRAPRMGLYAELPGNFDGLWANCPPDMDGSKRPLALGRPPRTYFTGAIHKMFAIKRGQTITVRRTITRSAINGAISTGCPTTLQGPGLHECGVTDLTLQITRLR